MRTIYLLSCVSRKAAVESPAEDLYQSDWFRKARSYALQQSVPGDSWFILSAEHHLLDPRLVLGPYEKTLLRMAKPERYAWAEQVLAQLGLVLRSNDGIVILAGRRYREFLEPALIKEGYEVSVPMRGLGIGKQLAWLKAALVKKEQPQ